MWRKNDSFCAKFNDMKELLRLASVRTHTSDAISASPEIRQHSRAFWDAEEVVIPSGASSALATTSEAGPDTHHQRAFPEANEPRSFAIPRQSVTVAGHLRASEKETPRTGVEAQFLWWELCA